MRLLKITTSFTSGAVFFGICLLLPINSYAVSMGEVDIKPRASLTTAYDDNVNFSNNDAKEDFVTTLSVGLDVGYEGKTQSLEVTGDIKQQLYAKESGFNNMSQDLRINFQKELSKYDRLSLKNRFTHAEEARSFDDNFGRTSGRYSYFLNKFDAEYTRDISKHVSLLGRYGNESYNASREDIRDSFMHRMGFDVNYIKSSATFFLLGYDFVTRKFDGGGTSNVHTIATGFRHFLTNQLYADARVGVSFVEGFDGSNTSEPNIVLALTSDFNETDSLSIAYRKTSMPSSFEADIFDSWRVAISLKQQLLERLKTVVSVFFGEGEFKAQSITDKQTGVSARLSYDLNKDVQTFLSYIYSHVGSNIDTRSYDRNLISIGATLRF